MAIAVNPDVRELDFSDNVKVSKFMQDFSDFRSKKWITYRPVNAPSPSAPFYGGTRQFIINMGTGHILDTLYSGLWFTLSFTNYSSRFTWPISTTMPKTAAAWIESVTFQHSNVAAHIDERLTDYDAVNALFTPVSELNTMKQTYFHNNTIKKYNSFNTFIADDNYAKLLPTDKIIGRLNTAELKFFIPLYRLSTVFNSGQYFFPSLLRGNGEMTLSIRSVMNGLSEIFGGGNSSISLYNGLSVKDLIKQEENPEWSVSMTEMQLITLNLDNAFLTKEYNAFIASGRKFIRSFKGYNYQYYEVKAGYNRIEIANTHQSISHIVLLFQSDFSMKINGENVSSLEDNLLYLQKTLATETENVTDKTNDNLYRLTRADPPKDIKQARKVHGDEATHVRLRIPKQSTGFSFNTDGTVAVPGDGKTIANAAPYADDKIVYSSQIVRPGTHNIDYVELSYGVVEKSAARATVIAKGYGMDEVSRALAYLLQDIDNTAHSISSNVKGSNYTQSATAQQSMRTNSAPVTLASSTHVPTLTKQVRFATYSLAPSSPEPEQTPPPPVDQTVYEAVEVVTGEPEEQQVVMDEIVEAHATYALPRAGEAEWRTYKEPLQAAHVWAILRHQNQAEIQKGTGFKFSYDATVTFLNSLISMQDDDKTTATINRFRPVGGANLTTKKLILMMASFFALRDVNLDNIQLDEADKKRVKFISNAISKNIPTFIKVQTKKHLFEQDEITWLQSLMAEDNDLKQLFQDSPDFNNISLMGLLRQKSGNAYSKVYEAYTASMTGITSATDKADVAKMTDYILDSIDNFFDQHGWRMINIYAHLQPGEAKQIYDIGLSSIGDLQVYRGTGNGETVFSEPINEDMFYHVSREATGNSADEHPYFKYGSFRKDGMSAIIISLNTFMRDAHHEFWDGFSTNRVADRLYVEFNAAFFAQCNGAQICPWYYLSNYQGNISKLICKVFTVYDNIYYIDRNNNLNVSDTLLPLQEGRGPISE